MTRAAASQIWDRFQSSYWFTPLVMSVAAFVLARVMLWVDAQIPDTALSGSPLIYTGSAVEARNAMLALSGALLTTGGVVYSLLTVPLSVAVSQFGSRLLRFYLRDSIIQLVLGMFVGAFVYCLIVALSIPPPLEHPDTPQLAATVGLYATILAFGMLIILIHHIATSLQAPNILSAASQELQHVVREFDSFWSNSSDVPASVPTTVPTTEKGYPIHAVQIGYIQALDPDVILPLAVKHDLMIRVTRKPGHFVQEGEVIALVYPANRVTPVIANVIQRCYRLGNLRTPSQDVEYAVNQLVEVTTRAMSAAINDPFTAITGLQHLGAGLEEFAQRPLKTANIFDEEQRLRLVIEPVTFTALLDAAFNLVRRASRENPDVLLAMLDALETVGENCTRAQDRADVLRHVNLVADESRASASIESDKARVQKRYGELTALLGSEPTHA